VAQYFLQQFGFEVYLPSVRRYQMRWRRAGGFRQPAKFGKPEIPERFSRLWSETEPLGRSRHCLTPRPADCGGGSGLHQVAA